MGAPAILKIEVLADTAKANAALGKTGDAAGKAGGGFSKMAKFAAGAVGTAAVVSFGKASVTAALESQKANANLEQGFKTMGDATGEAAKAAQAYASSLSKKIGVDDDAIIASQALLVTFGNVSNEAARGAGVFDRATSAAADLAAKGFGTMDSNATLLGKALNDPAAGLAKLAKNGVTFTDAQKKQIVAMQKSGDLLGAQKIMLGEVEKQVGGTAAATATSQEKMSVAFGETQEAVGGALLPVLEKLAPILETIAGFVEDNAGWLVPMAAAIGAVVLAVKAWSIAQGILNAVMSANPIGLIVIGIGVLIAAVVLIVKNWDKVKAALASTFEWLKRNWPLILAILTGPFGLAVLAIVKNWDSIKGAAKAVFDWIKGAATSVWKWVTDKFDAIARGVSGVVRGIKDTVGDIVAAIKKPINGVLRGWNGIQFKVPKVEAFGVSVGGQSIGVPPIPYLADGGTVMRTGFAVVHAGEQFSGVGRTFGGGSTVINLHVTAAGLGADAPEIQRAVVNALRGWSARNGALDVAVRSA